MRRRPTRAVQERKPPFYVGINIGKTLHHAYIIDAEGMPCVPKVAAFANTREGYAHLFTLLAEATGQAARTLLETWTLPENLAAVPTARLAAVLTRLSHGHFGAEKAREVKAAAQQSIGVRRAADALAFERRLLLRQIRELERLVAELDQEIGRRYAALDQYLRTIPGLGTATAPAIYAEIGDMGRFTDSDQLVALAGVDPQLHESGQTAGQAKMSKRGSPYLRRAI